MRVKIEKEWNDKEAKRKAREAQEEKDRLEIE